MTSGRNDLQSCVPHNAANSWVALPTLTPRNPKCRWATSAVRPRTRPRARSSRVRERCGRLVSRMGVASVAVALPRADIDRRMKVGTFALPGPAVAAGGRVTAAGSPALAWRARHGDDGSGDELREGGGVGCGVTRRPQRTSDHRRAYRFRRGRAVPGLSRVRAVSTADAGTYGAAGAR